MTFLSSAPLSASERADYGFSRAKDLAFDAVSSLWRKRRSQGLKQNEVAISLGRDPAWVNRALQGPGNWTLRTFGELVEALDGEIEIIVHDLREPPKRSTNYDAYAEYALAIDHPLFARANPVPLAGSNFFNSSNKFASAVLK